MTTSMFEKSLKNKTFEMEKLQKTGKEKKKIVSKIKKSK
jgi:hypothetical protein